MRLSPKQKAYWNAPFHRWNIKSGATRTGKTYLDYFMIPRRILERRGRDGLIVLMGNTRGTLQRNVLDPMAEMYGPALVGAIRSDNTAELFGEKAYCLGADSRKHVDRLRGASIKYCYGDEVVTWCEDVFEMLKSRLDKAYSAFDGTCNPENPDHWFKKFLDSDADIFQQSYCLDDNPFLPESVRDALKKEYHGVFYERYILGQWAVAEGLVFPYFGEDTEKYLAREIAPPERVVIGIDFGGNGSMTCMTATGFYNGMRRLTALAEAALPVGAAIDAGAIARAYTAFYAACVERFGRVDYVFGDSASPTMINTLISEARAQGQPWRMIGPCRKNPISQRPATIDRLLGAGRLTIAPECKNLIRALSSLRWDKDKPDVPEDKNEGNINDIYDSFCYSWLSFGDKIERL